MMDGKKRLNLDGTDFLGLLCRREISEACRQCIEKYGVGSCGPRAFYGTTDVHLHLEEHIARFLGVEESIVYSSDIATPQSVLPAFANRKDILVVDAAVYYPIQNGCHLSRAQIRTFKHNDVTDLERVLLDVDAAHRKAKKPLNRRFIVVEGIYHNCGDVAPLDKIYELKLKYRYHLIVDESLAFGVLGKTGRGACEEFGLAPDQVDLITASLSNAMASTGGFCAGNHDVIGHQRLNGYGYIFSASLPPFLAVAADRALTCLEEHPDGVKRLKENAVFVRSAMSAIPGLKLLGGISAKSDTAVSPVLHLELANEMESKAAREKLSAIVDEVCQGSNILLSVPEFSGLEWHTPSPTLRLSVSMQHTRDELMFAVNAIRDAAEKQL